MKKILFALFVAGVLFWGASCGDGDNNNDSGKNGSEATQNEDGTTTLKIQEDEDGFVSSTFSKATEFPGYTGTGYLDGGTAENGTIVYTVSAAEDISDAKIAIHYLATEVTRVRAALVSVNGTVINETSPLAMTTDVKVKKDNCTSANWKDTAYLTNVSLKAGSNSIMITGAPDGRYTAAGGSSIEISGQKEYLNYVDYLIVTGKGIDYGTDTTKYVSFSYASENETAGSVESSVTEKNVAENTAVTLTAKPNTDWQFDCWSDGTKENPYTFSVSKATYLFAHFIPMDYTASSDLVGYATLTADSATATYTITGGAGGQTITIASLSDLTSTENAEKLSSDVPYIVRFTSGTRITTTDNKSIIVNVGSNKTIYGAVAGAGLKNIEMRVSGSNVIIRNLTFGEVIAYDGQSYSGVGNDALALNGATHVWVDHCEFKSHTMPQLNDGTAVTNASDEDFAKDFYDGLLDIKNGATWITISNCYFHDHWKAVLCGSGDARPDVNSKTGLSDKDMRVTFYGNHWENIGSRQPLFRWGKAHIYNSYFKGYGSDASAVNCRAGSELYVEGNNFVGMKSTDYAIGYYYDTTASNSGSWVSKNNSGASNKSGTSYTPPYTYTVPISYPSAAPSGAGATLGSTLTYGN